MKQIKVPKEIMEVFYESAACRALSEAHDEGFFPSLKAIYYRQKAVKASIFAWRALAAAYPEVKEGGWVTDHTTGLATKEEPEVEVKPKKPRKPRAVKTEPATEGEKV